MRLLLVNEETLVNAAVALCIIDVPETEKTIARPDFGKTFRSTSSDPTVLTVPADADLASETPPNAFFSVLRGGSGSFTISGAVGVTVRARAGKTTSLDGLDAFATVVRTGANAWLVIGETEAAP